MRNQPQSLPGLNRRFALQTGAAGLALASFSWNREAALQARATPELLQQWAASIFVLDGDKIQRESRYYNMLAFLAQLGELTGDVLPSLGTPAAEPPA